MTEIPAPFEPPTECGGVGDILGKYFMWTIDHDIITAVFDTGEFIEFGNDQEGWTNFLVMGLFLNKAL